MKKKMLSIVMALFMAVTFMPCISFAADSDAMDSGDGTAVETTGPASETEATEPSETKPTEDVQTDEEEPLVEEEEQDMSKLASIEDEGQCGENVYWELDTKGVLTIYGTGEMYAYEDSCPDYFDYSEDVKKIVVKNGVTALCDEAFNKFEALTSVSLPSSLEKMGYNSFYGCSSLTSITIPKNVNDIIEYDEEEDGYCQQPFGECTKLKTVKVASGCVNYASVGGVLLSKDKSILIYYPEGKTAKSYTIPKSVTDIAYGAFYYIDRLQALTLPAKLKTIDVGGVFDQLPLTKYRISSKAVNYTAVNGVLFSKDKKELVAYPRFKNERQYEIPNGVITIRDWAFYTDYCKEYEDEDGGGMDYYGPLERIIVPETVEAIGSASFDGLNVIFKGDAPMVTSYNYSDDNSVDAYVFYDADRTGWSTPEWNGANANPYPNEIVFDEPYMEIGYGDVVKLNYSCEPENAASGYIKSLKSSNNKVAKVVADEEDGIECIEGVKEGTCTITAELFNGKKYSIDVEVYPQLVIDEDMIEDDELALWIGETYPLSIGAAGKVTWKTSNKRIATVSSKGVVKGISESDDWDDGCTITAFYKGEEYEVEVGVYREYPGYQGAYIDEYSYSKNTFYVEFENQGDHSVTVYPSGASYYEDYDDDFLYRGLKFSKTTIKPGQTKRIAMKVNGKKLYDTNEEDGEIWFKFSLHGKKYVACITSDSAEYCDWDDYWDDEEDWYDMDEYLE